MDVYGLLVSHIATLDSIAAVHVELPAGVDLDALPCVALHSAGPAQRRPALQGLGADVVGVDVHLYVGTTTWMTGQAHPLADALRRHLSRWRDGRAHVIDVTRPERLPDRNPNIRRLGMTADIIVPAFT